MELDATTVGKGGHQWLAAQLADWPAGQLGTQSAMSAWSQTLDSEREGGRLGYRSQDQKTRVEENDKEK